MQTVDFHAKVAVAVEGDKKLTDKEKGKLALRIEQVFNSDIEVMYVGGRMAAIRAHLSEGLGKDYHIADIAYKLARLLRQRNFSIVDLVDIMGELKDIDPTAYEQLVQKAA